MASSPIPSQSIEGQAQLTKGSKSHVEATQWSHARPKQQASRKGSKYLGLYSGGSSPTSKGRSTSPPSPRSEPGQKRKTQKEARAAFDAKQPKYLRKNLLADPTVVYYECGACEIPYDTSEVWYDASESFPTISTLGDDAGSHQRQSPGRSLAYGAYEEWPYSAWSEDEVRLYVCGIHKACIRKYD